MMLKSISKKINITTLFSALVIFLFTLFVYILLAGRLKWQFSTEPANYFSHLALALLNGRLDLIAPSWDHDLSKFNGKLYMYWGPTPLLIIIPIIYIFGINISDTLYTAIIGSFAPVIVYLILNKLNDLRYTKTPNIVNTLLAIFFAFGTVYFSVATRGGVWFTSQVLNNLYILISLLLIFVYVQNQKLYILLSSSLFFGLSVWGRNTYIFYLVVFIALMYLTVEYRLTKFIKITSQFFTVLILILIISFVYNFSRFGSVLENGYKYHSIAAKFQADTEKYGYMNLYYIPHNFYYLFLNIPKKTPDYPYLNFDPEGNSFVVLSPLFIMILFLVNKRYWKNKSRVILNGSVIFAAISIVLFQLCFFGTGWFQFGARYLLDIIPLLMILLLQVVKKTHWAIFLLLISLSIVFNTLGALWLLGIALW